MTTETGKWDADRTPDTGHGCSRFCRIGTLLTAGALSGILCACSTPKQGSGPAVDPELNRLSFLARSAYDRGDGQDAARLYEKALERARAMDRSVAIGNTAYNLATILFALGEYDRAREAVQEARDEFPGDGAGTTDAWLLEARIAHRQGLLDEANALADESLASLKNQKQRRYFLELYLLKAQVATERRDALEARTLLDVALTYYRESQPRPLRARVSEVKGQVLLLEERPGDAGQEFDFEANLLRSSGRYPGMAMALVRAGGAYEKGGLLQAAADRYYRAGRSMLAQGNAEGAIKIAEKAGAAATDAGDEKLANKARALLDRAAAAEEP